MCRYIAALIFLVWVSQALCSVVPENNPESRIVGGRPAAIQNYPFTVQIIRSSSVACGGSLVSQRCVLSAAHCFVGQDNPTPTPSLYTIRAGTADANQGGSTRQVTTIVIHPSYNWSTQDADVAVVVMRSNLTLSQTIGLASLPPSGFSVPDNFSLTVVGWGRTNPNVYNSFSSILNEVQVMKINDTVCARAYAVENLTVTPNMMCAGVMGVGGRDACQGDSGGPVIFGNHLVVGIVSWGISCAEPNFPGVNARVANFNSWILSTVARYNSAPSIATSVVMTTLSLLTSLTFVNKY